MASKRLILLVSVVLLAGLGAGAYFWANRSKHADQAEPDSNAQKSDLPPPTPSKDDKDLANLPLVQHMSKPVQADDLEFELISDVIWPMPRQIGTNKPEPGLPIGESPVQFQLRITNRGKKDIRLLSMVGVPFLQSAEGKEFPVRVLGSNHSNVPRTVPLEAGKSITIKGFAQLSTFHPGPSLSLAWEDEFGNVNQIDRLKPGKYLLKLQYHALKLSATDPYVKNSGTWLGDVQTATVPIEIVNLTASPPAVIDGIEISALVDSTWEVPAAGKQAQVNLGFRMRTLKEAGEYIIPRLKSLHIKSADGTDLTVKKSPATVSVFAPTMLTLTPDESQTLAIPALLFHGDNGLTLAWADGAGHVWHVENLKPGKYSIHFVVRATAGEPRRFVRYWVGELQTAAAMFDIKE